jgi:hypothetical protein
MRINGSNPNEKHGEEMILNGKHKFSRSNVMVVSMVLLWIAASGELYTRQNLSAVLKGAADYCQRLSQEIFHFACEETITETGLKKKKYQSLYQIIKIGERIKEKRTLIRSRKNGSDSREMKIATKLYSYRGALTPILLLSAKNQKNYRYTYLKKEKVMRRWAHCLEVRLGAGARKDTLAAQIWIDRDDFSVLRFKVFPEAATGFDHIIAYAQQMGMKYNIKDVHEFGYLRHGIRFPTKTIISIELVQDEDVISTQSGFLNYTPRRLAKRRIKTVFKYRNYLFFKVDVSRPVFKGFKKQRV